mgnify:CR=1 FL=1
MNELRLPREARMRQTREFENVYAQQHRAGDQFLLVFAAANELGRTRFGLSVSRKHGSAVRRARIKRLLREAFRLSRTDLPAGLDLILIPRQGVQATVDDYRRSLRKLSAKLARRIGVLPHDLVNRESPSSTESLET